MYNHNYSNIFLIIIILIISSQSKKQIMLLDGDDLDSQINLSSKSNTKLFLIFFVEHCVYCTHALKILKEKIVKNFEDEDEISFGVVNLDDQKNLLDYTKKAIIFAESINCKNLVLPFWI